MMLIDGIPTMLTSLKSFFPQKQTSINFTVKSLSKANVWFLFVCQFCNLLLVVSELSLWMLLVIGLCFFWQSIIICRSNTHSSAKSTDNSTYKPKRYLITLLAISGCIALVITGKELGVLLSMLHLLCFSYALKALELNITRVEMSYVNDKNKKDKKKSSVKKDFYQCILLGIFILATSLIFQQSLVFSLVAGLVLLVNFAVLLYFFSPLANIKTRLILSGKLLLQSLPLAIVLFVVFPRLSPFWQVPLNSSAKTGLSDILAPGDIANLARSNELAFNVTFLDKTPVYSQRYWRALVLDAYDGNRWYRSQANKEQATPIIQQLANYQPEVEGEPTTYQIIAQPSFQSWLYALDVAKVDKEKSNDATIFILPDFTLFSKKPLNQTMSYHVESFLTTPLNITLNDELKARNLLYPVGTNPQLEQEAIKLKQQFKQPEAIVNEVLQQFRQQAFYYTLNPPLLINNSLDQFYFETKKGFCVHYASAFTYLMRAAGVPARVVTGYLGGEYNPNGSYYSLYQYDAHAWSEVWLEGIGWQRVDPTAAVNPQRVEQGLSDELLLEQNQLNNNIFSLHNYRDTPWLNYIRLQLSAIDYQWTRWVIGYSAKRQYDLLSRWFGQVQSWKTALIIGMTLLLVVLLLWWLQQRKTPIKTQLAWVNLYNQALQLLSKKGLTKPLSLSANEFASDVQLTFPEVSNNFNLFTQCFMRLQYQKLSSQEQDKLLIIMKKEWLKIRARLKRIKKS